MGAVILLVIVLCGLLASRVYIKRQRHKLREERERKLKIAEGIFDDTPNKPATKRKKRRWGWMQSDTLPAVPDFLERELIRKAPVLVERMLQRRHALLAAREALRTAERTHKAAQAAANGLALPARLERANLDAWAAQAKATCLAVRETGRAFHAREQEYCAADSDFTSARQLVDRRLNSFTMYDCDELSPEAARILEISRTALTECQVQITKWQDEEPPRYFAEPESVDAELAELCEKLANAVNEMLGAVAAAYVSHAETEREFSQLNELAKGPAISEPQRPVEDEVQALLAPVFDWASRIQSQEALAHSKLPQIAEALKNLDQQTAAVKELLAELRARENRKPERPSLPPLPPPVEAAPELPHTGVPSPVGPIALKSMKPWLENWDLDDDGLPASRWKATGKAFVPATRVETATLTDAQESVLEASGYAMAKCDGVGRSIRAAVERWSRRPPQVFKPGQPDESEQATLAALNAALRKLGFAVAQRNAAHAKLAAVRAAGPQLVELNEPSLAESNAESFVRSHHKWCADTDGNGAAQKEHWQRISAQQQQYDERQRQVAPAVTALGSQISFGATGERTQELDAAVRVATHLKQVFTASVPAVAPPPKSKSSSSSSSARKSRARRRR